MENFSWFDILREHFQESGNDQFTKDVMDGFYIEYALDIIHPTIALKEQKDFESIFKVFVDVYV